MGKTKTKSRSVGDSPKPPITIRSTNVKILDDNIAKLEKAIQAGDVSANPSGTAEETLLSTIGIDGKKYELGPSAENTSYDNTDSGLTATDTQGAIDEIVAGLNAPAASSVTYDNTDSGLTADDVQGAIDEVNAKSVKKKKITYSNLANSDTTKYYIVLTSTPLADINDNATEILGITVTGFNGYPDITDRILPNAIMDSGSVLTVFEKGKTFSNVSLDITYIYR